jgi:hypothetical protein
MQTTTLCLWNAIEEGEILSSINTSGYDNAVIIDVNQDVDDGTFPTLASYTRAVNQIEDDGISAWINRMTRKKSKLEIDLGEYKIIRTAPHETTAILEFKEPIEVKLGKIGDRLHTAPVKRIKGEFFHEYFFTKGGRQDKIANGFEIWFSIQEYME